MMRCGRDNQWWVRLGWCAHDGMTARSRKCRVTGAIVADDDGEVEEPGRKARMGTHKQQRAGSVE